MALSTLYATTDANLTAPVGVGQKEVDYVNPTFPGLSHLVASERVVHNFL